LPAWHMRPTELCAANCRLSYSASNSSTSAW
jgi:hypothetical protein